MRAVVVENPGGPEALVLKELDSPTPGEGEVRVDVRTAGVNFIDIYQRSGAYPLQTPFVAGSEGAGVVSAVGAGVDDLKVGDRVAWSSLNGAGYAEQVLVPADRAVPIPDGVDEDTAVAVMTQGMTAHFLCNATFDVQPHHDVLIHAAAGGVGLMLTQLVSAKGARVIGVVSTEEKAKLATDAGAADVILTDQDWGSAVRRLTDGRGVDVVYDGVGKATFDTSLDCLRPRGMMVLFGAASGKVPPFDPQILNPKGSLFLTRPTISHYIADRDELLMRAGDVLGAVAEGKLSVRIGGRYSLDEAAQAHEDLASRRTTGKLLIVP